MEKIIEASIVQESEIISLELNSCFDQFMQLKPKYDTLGDAFFELLNDATKSFIKSVAKSSDNTVLIENCDSILQLTSRYAKLYFSLNCDDSALLMLRSALYDLLRGYDYDNKKYDQLASNVFEGIRRLITV